MPGLEMHPDAVYAKGVALLVLKCLLAIQPSAYFSARLV